jgi:hypothetical protein
MIDLLKYLFNGIEWDIHSCGISTFLTGKSSVDWGLPVAMLYKLLEGMTISS